MKLILHLLSVSLAAIAVADGHVHLEEKVSGYLIDAGGGSFASDQDTGVTAFSLHGNALAQTIAFQLRASYIEGKIGPDPAPKGQQTLLNAEATGNVIAVRRLRDGRLVRTTTFTGSAASYREANQIGKLKLTGPVSITDVVEGSTSIKATGSAGNAELDVRAKGASNGLRKATLDRNVKIDILKSGSKGTHVLVTGDTMLLDNTVKPPRITLTGKIVVQPLGNAQFPAATGFEKVVITLDDHGQIVRFKAGGGN